MKRKIYFSLFLLLMSVTSFHTIAGVIINEMMPCNISTYMNGHYNYVGWVELYNDGEDDIDIKGYTFKNLKKGGSEKWSWTINHSCKIGADEYLLYYFDELEGEDNHAGYKIDSDGGILKLLNGETEVSSVTYTQMYPHLSFGYYDGNLGYMEPTPKKDNKTSYSSISSRCKQPTFSTTPGIQNSEISLSIKCATDGAKIYYTTNGSEPTKDSKEYTEPLNISKTKVIRAKAFKDDMLSSAIATGTYLYVDDSHKSCGGFTAPILCITTDSANFYDSKIGIYTTGTNGVSNTEKSCLSESANYNQDWDRPIHLEYFVDGLPVISQECEVAVMGGCSRQYSKKTLKINANKKSGNNQFDYDFFPEKAGNKYKSIQLRNGGNAYESVRPRDGFMQSIAATMGIDCQAYMPVAYYIDGHYAGLMGLRERSGKDYVYSNYGLDEEEIDLVEYADKPLASCGTLDAYESLVEAVQDNPESDTYFAKMSKLIDMDEYMDFHIFEQFIVNTDWPGNNTKMWREKKNGRFRWIIYDTDFGFGLYDAGGPNYTGVDMNMLQFAMGEGVTNWANDEERHIVLFKNLMKNNEFQKRFLTRYLYHLKYTFTEEKIDSIWGVIVDRAGGEYCAWKDGNDLDNDGSSMLSFAHSRPSVIYNNLKSFYKGGEKIDLNVAIKDEDGKLIPNAEIIMNYEPTGTNNYSTKYFTSLSLRLEPKAPYGYVFKKWETSKEIAKTTKSSSILSSSTEWSYFYAENAPEGEWKSLEYVEDSSWSQGVCPIGVESKNVEDKTKLDGKYNASYYRCKFNIDDLESIDSLFASIIYDDGIVIYVNGNEVKRYNLPEGDMEYETLAPTYTNDAEESFYITRDMLVEGENIIAAEVHQTEGSGDMTFSLQLSAIIGGSVSKGELLECSLTSDMTLTAVYSKVDVLDNISLQLNEICSSNDSNSGNEDEYGNFPDWIEVYNYGDKDIDMAGFYFTDNLKNLTKSKIPYGSEESIIKAGEHKVFYADNTTWRGTLHTDFKISSSGSQIALVYNKYGVPTVLDSITVKSLVTNDSYGRQADGSNWIVFGKCDEESVVTFAEANNDVCLGNTDSDDFLTENIENVENEGIRIYPNPVSYNLTIESFDNSLINSVEVFNSLGERVLYQFSLNSDIMTLDVAGLNSGIYNIMIVTEKSVYSNKFIKK